MARVRPGSPVLVPGGGRVLAFGRSKQLGHLTVLEIARAPVAKDHVARDALLSFLRREVAPSSPNNRGDLELVVELIAARRDGNFVARAQDPRWVAEVKDRELIPVGRHLTSLALADCLDVLFEGQEIAD